MGDTAPSRKGLRAFFGSKPKQPASRKKLTKKNAPEYDIEASSLDPAKVNRDSHTTDSYALSRESSNVSKESDLADVYHDMNATTPSAPHTFRDNPYAAISQDYSTHPDPRSQRHDISHDRQYDQQHHGQGLPKAGYHPSQSHVQTPPYRQAPQSPHQAFDYRPQDFYRGHHLQQALSRSNPSLGQQTPHGKQSEPSPYSYSGAGTFPAGPYDPSAMPGGNSRFDSAAGLSNHPPSSQYPMRAPPSLPSQPAPNLSRLHKEHREKIDKDTGERKDITEMMHALNYDPALDNSSEGSKRSSLSYDPSRPDGMQTLAGVTAEIWDHIADFLNPEEIGNLSVSCRTLNYRLGQRPFQVLNLVQNRQAKIDFLMPMDHKLPKHLLCFPCATYHLRIEPGKESLKPNNVVNPLFICPNSTNMVLPPPRMRLTEGRNLPFSFVQLIKRFELYGPEYGIPLDSLARRWKDPYSAWTHQTRYHIAKNGHVLVRVKSQVFAEGSLSAASQRMLLYSRGDYTPYFSVCAHWRDGVLMDACKCALRHIPVPKPSAMAQIRTQRAAGVVSLCSECRPMRRCPECPTEYLIELKLTEDTAEARNDPARFKQTLIVTRWSDLGDGSSPMQKEWAACVGDLEGFDSFAEIGKRAISGVFESAFSDATPGQRIMSMNPKGIKKGEAGTGWY